MSKYTKKSFSFCAVDLIFHSSRPKVIFNHLKFRQIWPSTAFQIAKHTNLLIWGFERARGRLRAFCGAVLFRAGGVVCQI